MSATLDRMHVQKLIERSPALGKDTINDEGTAINGLEPGVSGEMKQRAADTIWEEPRYPTEREWEGEYVVTPRGQFRIK